MGTHIHVVVPVHNRRTVTEGLILDLCRQSWRDFTLFLVDDGSTDGTADMVRTHLPGTVVLQGDGTLWWGGALHLAYRTLCRRLHDGSSRADDLVLILNDDTRIGPAFLEQAATLLRPRSMLLARAFDLRTGRPSTAGVQVDWRRLQFDFQAPPEKITCFSTRGLVLRLGDFRGTGGFRPRLLPHYLSDYEFTIRAHRRGLAFQLADAFQLQVDLGTTGLHRIQAGSARDYLAKLFSKKAPANPVYFSVFVLLCCPWRFVPRNLARLWLGALRGLERSLRSRARPGPGRVAE
ncbi:glycosyltransferase family 2 protein [Oleisolibacter albus]|uniref:glycosyltransferase family 2 protein n=1 Tax=Oleisolibacter albus TaxID=2171757 RepID=UPI00138FA2A5|nr:glycosyltransferase [Oleisolibacter albus]